MPEYERYGQCHEEKHRAIPLRFPYAQAKLVHVKLTEEIGADRVSKQLREIEGGWEVVICRACAERDNGRGNGTA